MVLSGNRGVSEDSSNQMAGLDVTSQNPAVEGTLQAPPVQTKAENYFRQGLDKFNRGDYRSAIEDFNQALQINPEFAEAYKYRAKSRYSKGDYLGAIKDYSQVLRINPLEAGLYSDRGLLRAHAGDRWGAMQDYNQALQIDANCVHAYLNRSFLRVELEDHQGAIADCNEALTINPNLAEAYLNRGLAQYELEDYQGAMEDYNQALQINPDFATAYFNRGVNFVTLGEYQDAIADFNQVLQLNPNDAQAYLNRGYIRLELGDNGGSIEDFDQALTIDPVSAKAFLSQIAPNLMDEQEAFEDENQQLIQGLIVQGNLRYELGNYQEAINAYERVLNLAPNNIEAYNRRSTARSALGDYEGAMEDLEKAKALSLSNERFFQPTPVATVESTTAKNLSLSNEQSFQPTPVATVQLSAKDYYHRGLEKLQKEDFRGAIEDFNKSLEMDNKDATALTCRGFAYGRLGDNQRAIEDLRMAAKLFYEQGNVKSAKEILGTLKKLQLQ